MNLNSNAVRGNKMKPSQVFENFPKELAPSPIIIEELFSSGNIGSTAVIRGEIDPAIVACFAISAVKALSQYRIDATVGEMIDDEDFTGAFSSRIALTDEKSGIQIVIVLFFPKLAACHIYESLFGEVEMQKVPGVVHELGNILAGLAKVKLSKWQSEVIKTVYPEKPDAIDNNFCLNFQTGLPEVNMDVYPVPESGLDNTPRFTLPIDFNFGKLTVLVSFHKI